MSKTQMRIIGASNHADHEREKDDFYVTDPIATVKLCELEKFNTDIWEPACGMGHMSKVLTQHGYRVRSSDIVNRGYGDEIADFLHQTIYSGMEILLQTHRTSTQMPLWRKHCRLFKKAVK